MEFEPIRIEYKTRKIIKNNLLLHLQRGIPKKLSVINNTKQ